MNTFVERPHSKKPKLCVWTDLNAYNTDRILKCGNNVETRNILEEIFGLHSSPRNEILLDMYLHAIVFAKLQNFSKEQLSAFFSILKQTHDVCVSTPFGNVEECFSLFRELILTHSVHRPPWSLEIFSPDQVETITTHVINTYFRHYKLYKYAFTPKVKLDIALQYEGLAPTPVELQISEPTPDHLDPAAPSDISENVSPSGPSDHPTPSIEEPVVDEKKAEEQETTNELESVVRKAVVSQLKQMQFAVDRQLEDTDKIINEKILSLESGGAPGSGKGQKSRTPRSSAKGKRK